MEPPGFHLDPDKPILWGILLLPDFPLLSFGTMLDPLRVATSLTGSEIYDWVTISTSGRTVQASCGITIETDYAIEDAPSVDRIVVVSGVGAHDFNSNAAFAWIRREIRRGVAVGAISDASFFLARGGLLQGYRCTVHWIVQSSFREAFPHLELTGQLYEIDRDRFTAMGGTGTLDMMLALIEMDHGADVASAVSQWFVHQRRGSSDETSPISVHLRTGISDNRVLRAISVMEAAIEDPVRAQEVASRIGVSIDTLERAFRRETGQTAMQYFKRMRLARARDLIVGSALSIGEIAQACGFNDSSSFARAYRGQYGTAPRADRAARV